MITTFRHWRDVPESAWRWRNFSPAEIACRGTGKLLVNEPALDRLQALRDRLGKPLIVRSAYRSPEHNRAVGGATRSKHMDGAAFDIAMTNHDPVAFEAAAREVGFLGFGFYPRSGFMHVDLGPARQWGERFPMRTTTFVAETPAVMAPLLIGFAASPWMRAALRYGAIILALLLFLLSLRRSGERAGRLAERLQTTEKANDVQRQMLEATARRPRSRDELAERLRNGRF